GPDNAVIESGKELKTKVSELQEGTYVFTLTVTDDAGETASADVKVTVKKRRTSSPSPDHTETTPPNEPPAADAGKDRTLILPTNTVTLDGSASMDRDGEITSYHWKKRSGPDGLIIEDKKE